jgi:hypothetical protein
MTMLKDLPNLLKSQTIQPSFKEIHVILALIIINDQEKGIGRYRLKNELNLPEGAVKSLLTKMKKNELIETDSRISGHKISQRGQSILTELFTKITPPEIPTFDYKSLVIGQYAYYSLARNIGDHVKSGIEQRDDAIKIGGTGATCLIFKDKILSFPKSSIPDSISVPPSIKTSELKYDIKENDVLVIGAAENQYLARLVTLNVCYGLIKKSIGL